MTQMVGFIMHTKEENKSNKPCALRDTVYVELLSSLLFGWCPVDVSLLYCVRFDQQSLICTVRCGTIDGDLHYFDNFRVNNFMEINSI